MSSILWNNTIFFNVIVYVTTDNCPKQHWQGKQKANHLSTKLFSKFTSTFITSLPTNIFFIVAGSFPCDIPQSNMHHFLLFFSCTLNHLKMNKCKRKQNHQNKKMKTWYVIIKFALLCFFLFFFLICDSYTILSSLNPCYISAGQQIITNCRSAGISKRTNGHKYDEQYCNFQFLFFYYYNKHYK